MGGADWQAAAYRAYRQIMAAARAGTISPEGALRWARTAAQGEPVEVLASLSGPPRETRLAWMAAAARSDLAQRVLDILMQMVDEAGRGTSVSPEFAGLFGHQEYPPEPVVYPGGQQGRRDRRPVTSWDGYVSASVPGEMSDEEADLLYPPATAQEADRRAQDARQVRASSRVEDMSDEELHRLLFGDTAGGELGP